eukprot:4667998-Prymnesium_polylepis.1
MRQRGRDGGAVEARRHVCGCDGAFANRTVVEHHTQRIRRHRERLEHVVKHTQLGQQRLARVVCPAGCCAVAA